MRTLGFLPLLGVLLLPLTPLGSTTYAVDAEASHVVVHVDKAGLFSFAGHTHEVAAPVASGLVTVDSDDLSAFDAAPRLRCDQR